MSGLAAFSDATRAWFETSFREPTPVQTRGWAQIAKGEHTLMLAPTGSGKTLAAFLWAIDKLSRLPQDIPPGVRILYVSPLKALAYDVEKNLRSPLIGVGHAARRLGLTPREISVFSRTGDTPQKDRQRFRRKPTEILITTPESLYLLLTSQARDGLKTVETVIIDEIHTMAGTKRGVHLALSLERLSHLCDSEGDGEPQRIGLSATQRPLSEIARYLGGDRGVQIVDASAPPSLDLAVHVPVRDMEQPWIRPNVEPVERAPPEEDPLLPMSYEGRDDKSIWPALTPEILKLIQDHTSTIVFVNSRILCERLAQQLNELAGEELVMAHHGSIAHRRRTLIEEQLKTGQLRGIVATSSLELGIDMGAVDLVIQVGSPGAVARGLQRVGRAGHGVGQRSVARIFPKYRGDLLEAGAVAWQMLQGNIERTRVPRNPLDVLAQQIVATCSMDDWKVDELFTLFARAASFKELSADLFTSVLDMLSGRYPSEDFRDLRPRIDWDRDSQVLSGRRGAQTLALINAGTIPDRGLYSVHIGDAGGPRIGELDEEMVHESRRGNAFILGASTWRILDITRDRVLVEPAPGVPARMPFWRGQGPGRPVELGRALGEFTRQIAERDRDDAEQWLREHAPMDEFAVRNLVEYVAEQREATGAVPSDTRIVIERFRDDLGDWRICVLSPFGSRVHAPWALAIEAQLSDAGGYEVQALWSDDGILVRFADAEELPSSDTLIPDPEEIEELLLSQLDRSALFSARFRENAARALLLPRRRPGKRTPLWQQRLRAQSLMTAVARHPSFPIVLETWRECLQDVFDLPGLKELLSRIRRREVRVVEAETSSASPFARSLVFAYVASYLYEGDAPLAERKAQALSLDRNLLRELLGQEALRDLLDASALAEVEDELQGRAESRQAKDAEGLRALLRRVGDLRLDELQERAVGPVEEWLDQLERKVLEVRIAGEERWIAVEDAARYRDALGVAMPVGVPAVFLEPVEDPLRDLILRYAKTHGPFLTREAAARFGLLPAQVLPVLTGLEREERIIRGELRPGGSEREWCDQEVLRRLRRRSLARLRNEIAAVDGAALARFLPRWQAVGSKRRGQARLDEVVDQMEGLAMPFSELEGRVLPSRVRDFQPRMLDELSASGQLVWVGRGALGPKDGRVALYRRERMAGLLPGTGDHEPSALGQAILEHLGQRGASFFTDLQGPTGASAAELLEAIWDLAWAGRITNDTFHPLRALSAPKRSVRGAGRGRSLRRVSGAARSAGGRWSRVVAEEIAPTRAAHSRAVMLLERYGVVSREMALSEELEGGFSSIYPVLKAMEEGGQVRRGWFVEGLSGAQFALPGAVDSLRAQRDVDQLEVHILGAMDPANPYGRLLPWPDAGGDRKPRRAAGAVVVLTNGHPVLWLPRNGKHLVSFPNDDEQLEPAARALVAQARRHFTRSLELELIDGAPARESPLAPTLVAAGFVPEGRLLRLPDY